MLGPALFPGEADHPLKSGEQGVRGSHHRMTSSSVSFLRDLDVGGFAENPDAEFLRHVQASNATHAGATSPNDSDSEDDSVDRSGRSQTRLAEGGTSKRIRRKCTVENCANRVVQGGLCIAHGAKRKTCSYVGCNKNVKKAGLCSTHGPARKRCDHPSCTKVAVQGGRCIAHGAKKKLCLFEGCQKQAILSGMCKKHHDESKLKKTASAYVGQQSQLLCSEIPPPPAANEQSVQPKGKPTHARGLSIFHEITADAVSDLFNASPPGDDSVG
jgi:hypothetical protein